MIFRHKKLIYSFFFLASFVLLRVVNPHTIFHAYTDDNSFQDCEQCDFIANSNQITALEGGNSNFDFNFKEQWDDLIWENYLHYAAPDQKILHTDYFYNKPPPSFS